MRAALGECFWPDSQCGEMIAAGVRAAGLPLITNSFAGSEPEACCLAMGLECERIIVHGDSIAAALRQLAPGALSIPGHGNLLLVDWRGSSGRILTPSGRLKVVRMEQFRDLLLGKAQAPMETELADLFALAGVPERRRTPATRAMIAESLSKRQVATGWQIRTSPSANFWWQLRDSGMASRLLVLGLTHFGEIACFVAAWIAVGRGALSGRTDPGWLMAWALLLLTLVPLRVVTTWSQGLLAVGIGGLLKQRLLVGAMSLEPDSVRGQGTGRLLGRVLESEALESMALSGGMATLLALFEAGAALAIMSLGAAPVLQPLAYGVWIVVVGALICTYTRRRSLWTDSRLAMTHGLVERMAGHRTRLVQQPREDWHSSEDQELDNYLTLSHRLDGGGSSLRTVPARGWLLVGLLALSGRFLSNGVQTTDLAVSIGGILLGYRALSRFSSGAWQLAGAIVSWRQVSPIFTKAAQPAGAERADVPGSDPGPVVIDAQELSFRYKSHIEPALRGCDLRIAHGEMVLLEGSSGCGKSTLAAILAGLRKPDSGLLLSGGLDIQSLGESGWRRRVAVAPQHHENHIFSGPLAFNLLMSRNWPATRQDLTDAEEVCRELGLGGLLDRMPAGLMQMVGETGWQLSEGERSRVFLARALLQRANLVVLDETFAALDPENLGQSIECALRRAQSLLVIAHP